MVSKKILSVVPHAIRVIRGLSLESLDGSMPLQQLRVLYLISEGKRQSEMAEILQVSSAAISKVMNILVDKKYVGRRPSLDRRCVELHLTKEGKKVLTLVSGHIGKKLENKINRLTKKEQIQLELGLSVLEKLMGQLNEA